MVTYTGGKEEGPPPERPRFGCILRLLLCLGVSQLQLRGGSVQLGTPHAGHVTSIQVRRWQRRRRQPQPTSPGGGCSLASQKFSAVKAQYPAPGPVLDSFRTNCAHVR